MYPDSWAVEWYTRVRMEHEDPFCTSQSGDSIIKPSLADRLWRDGFFVRQEYETLWQYIASTKESLVVTGHPGIGSCIHSYIHLSMRISLFATQGRIIFSTTRSSRPSSLNIPSCFLLTACPSIILTTLVSGF